MGANNKLRTNFRKWWFEIGNIINPRKWFLLNNIFDTCLNWKRTKKIPMLNILRFIFVIERKIEKVFLNTAGRDRTRVDNSSVTLNGSKSSVILEKVFRSVFHSFHGRPSPPRYLDDADI